MNIAEAIAFSALMIGLIAVTGIWLDAYKRRLTNREKELELQARIAEAKGQASEGEVTRLEERLRVLERIATDPAASLSTQIEGLREPSETREKVQ